MSKHSNINPAAEGQPPVQASVPGHVLEQQRRSNREEAAKLGVNPYGTRTDGLISLAEARARYDDAANSDFIENSKTPGYSDPRPRASVAGRVMLLRDGGKLIWMTIRDHTDALQIAVSQRDCSELGFKLAKLTDLADVIVVSGRVMKTKTGEITIWADDIKPAAKSLVPPPEKHAGLTDVEIRYRQRYTDLWANPETMAVFQQRSAIVGRIRKFMESRGYLEVETPMLQSLAGGAAARPFVTKMNALDINLFMRIAPELYLKRLLVGGMPKVFEVNRNFRNEGLDKQHNPEFTMLEAYHAFGDVETVMELTESAIRDAASFVFQSFELNPLRRPAFDGGEHRGNSLGYVFDNDPPFFKHIYENRERFTRTLPREVLEVLRLIASNGDNFSLLESSRTKISDPVVLPFGDLQINYSKPFVRVTYAELFEKGLGYSMHDTERAKKDLAARNPQKAKEIAAADPWFVVNELFELKGEHLLDPSRPTFITDYPSAISPLTRPKPTNPALADRADLFIAGMEIAPHYTELNDPDVQEAKFKEQLQGIDADKSAEENTFRTMDHDFLRALKVGMPPAGGMGLGVDRLVMILTNQRTIRDVMLFPLMRPEA